ncbi:MAG: DUF2723 domain-containing protein [Candidatus Schekmanbacteria bacterium]|nr:MAG: DUF2723 domain-containing protein [Candidatus Schekmanbacteria bacterium]
MKDNNKNQYKHYLQLLFVFLSAQLFYFYTLAPTVLWGDQAIFQRLAYTLDFYTQNTYKKHLLWIILAHPVTKIPINNVAFRVNLFTSFWAAIAVFFVFALLKNLTSSFWASLSGAAALMVSHNFWFHAVHTEVYSFNMALLAITLYYFTYPKAQNIHYLLGSITIGMAVTNHRMMWLAVPALVILITGQFFEKKIGWSQILFSFAGFIITIIFLKIILSSYNICGTSTFTLKNYIPNWIELPYELLKFAAYWVLQFPSPALIIMIIGIRKSIKNFPLLLCLAFIWAANIFFLININFPDKYVFYMLSYFVGAIWIGLGVEPVLKWLTKIRWSSQAGAGVLLVLTILVCPILTYTLAPRILPLLGITSEKLGIREIPGRPALKFFLLPSARDYWGAHNYAETVLNSLPPNATIMADYTVAQPMLYLQAIEKVRPDVNVAQIAMDEQKAFVSSYPKDRPLFLALTKPYYDINGISHYFTIVPCGLAYKLEPKE